MRLAISIKTIITLYPVIFGVLRVGVMAAFPNKTIKCRYEMLLRDKENNTVYMY